MRNGATAEAGTGSAVRHADNPNVPKLRFPEFSGAWKVSYLEDLSTITSGGTPKREITEYWDGDIPWVTTSEIKGAIITAANQSISHLGLRSSSAKIFEKNTVLVAMYGQGQTRGRVGLLSIRAATNQACAAIIPKSGSHADFLFQNLSRRYEELRDLANDGSQKNLSGALLKRLSVALPTLPEQQKIAAFLGAVDAKLAALAAKQAALGRFKAGLMQKLFSQQLRFTRDDGKAFPDWEEKRLGDLLTVRYGKDHKALPDGDIPVLGTGGVMRHVNRALHSGPSVLIGRKGTIDQPRFVTSPFWTVDTLFYSDIKKGWIPFFAYLVVQSVNWLKFNEATGVPSLSVSAIHGVKVTVPTHPDEQAKIADALSAMDAKIQAVADQIAGLETFKKGLLQQMFV